MLACKDLIITGIALNTKYNVVSFPGVWSKTKELENFYSVMVALDEEGQRLYGSSS